MVVIWTIIANTFKFLSLEQKNAISYSPKNRNSRKLHKNWSFKFGGHTLELLLYSWLPFGVGTILGAPSSQFAGQTSPCCSTNWNALTNLNASSIFLPTGKSLTIWDLTTPLSSMMKRPRNAMPASSKTPYRTSKTWFSSQMRHFQKFLSHFIIIILFISIL